MFTWRRPLRGRELIWEQSLLHDLLAVRLCQGVPDKWIWLPSGDGNFSVQSFYYFLQGPSFSAFSAIWNSLVPSNVKAFAWRVVLNHIASLVSLRRRQVPLPMAEVICFFCQQEEETSFNLLFDCQFSREVWSRCYSWVGCSFAPSLSAQDHLLQFKVRSNKSQQRVLFSIWMAAIWSLWILRNDCAFRGKEKDVSAVMDLIQWRSWQWNKARLKSFVCSCYEWNAQPLLCVSGIR